MIRLGLCSGACITRDINGVIAAAAAARLDAIEWSADVHLGAGNHQAAEETMIATLTAGLTTVSYATLYQAGGIDEGFVRFDALLATAAVLQTPILRIYAAIPGKKDFGTDRDEELVVQLRHLGDRAAQKGITVCLSMGRGTGLDRYDRALGLVSAVGHEFIRLAWEDLPLIGKEEATTALERAGRFAGMLIARCAGRDGAAHPVAGDEAAWRTRLGAFKSAEPDPGMGSFVLLGAAREEGKPGEESLAADADAMRAIIGDIEP